MEAHEALQFVHNGASLSLLRVRFASFPVPGHSHTTRKLPVSAPSEPAVFYMCSVPGMVGTVSDLYNEASA